MKYNFNKYIYLFLVNKKDKRSDFFLLIIFDLICRNKELNSYNLYNSPFTNNMKENPLWITYCMDLACEDIILDKIDSIDINIIVDTFFTEDEKNNKITRRREKIIKFTNITPTIDYKKSTLDSFNFSDETLKDILRKMLQSIPNFNQISIDIINPVKKCLEKTKMTYLEHIDKCISGKDINKCIEFMKNEKYMENITDEVIKMDTCIAVDTLIKFGFKVQDKHMETYDMWEKRILIKLNIKQLNPQLKQYILLLIQKVNPILELKLLLSSNKCNNMSIANILYYYKKIYPQYSSIIDEYIILEKKFLISQYIVDNYSNLLKIFNTNRDVFNFDNNNKYNNLYHIIKDNFNIKQLFLLETLEKQNKIL